MGNSWRPRGVYVPLVTPFDNSGVVDVDALERLASAALDGGAAGVVVLATTGESTSLDDEERWLVARTCAAVCADRGRDLIVGAGTNDTRTTLVRHDQLGEIGNVRASLAVVPYYVRPSEDGVVQHFAVVAERSPVPVVVYNVPHRTGLEIGVDCLLTLAAMPNVVGVKQAVGAVDATTLDLLCRRPADFSVLAGDDAFVCTVALMGGDGAISASANVMTETWVAMVDAAMTGDVVNALRLHADLLPLAQTLFAEPSPAVIKGILHRLGMIPTPAVRLPLVSASPASIEAAWQALARVGEPVGARVALGA